MLYIIIIFLAIVAIFILQPRAVRLIDESVIQQASAPRHTFVAAHLTTFYLNIAFYQDAHIVRQ